MTWNTVSVLCMSQLGSTEWEIQNVLAVFQVGSLLVHCPFPCDVLAVFLVGTLPLAPSEGRRGWASCWMIGFGFGRLWPSVSMLSVALATQNDQGTPSSPV